jgi:RNA polymerase sigma-70 factor, ECF subfamily
VLEGLRESEEQTMNTQATTLRNEGQECTYGNVALADERSLVAQAKSGRSNAFGELYERHRRKIYRSVFRIVGNPEDAEDVVQRSFQRAFTNLCRFREDSTFATWVTRIAINEALMMLRRRRTTTPLSEINNDGAQSTPVLDLVDRRPTPEQAAVQSELHATLIRAISRLRKNLQTVVLLREFQGLTSVETARILGLSVSAVKARTFHARRHLRRHLRRKYRSLSEASDWSAK